MAGKRRTTNVAREGMKDLRRVRAEWLKTAIATFRSRPIPPPRAHRPVRQIGGQRSGMSRRRAGDVLAEAVKSLKQKKPSLSDRATVRAVLTQSSDWALMTGTEREKKLNAA